MRATPYPAKHCAILPGATEQLLAAITIINQQIIFTGFQRGTLQTLAKKFSAYGLVLGIPDEYLDVHTHFFPLQDTPKKIYRNIANKITALQTSHWFDFERIETNETNHTEQLIISYHLRNNTLLKPYQELGFVFTALEPCSTVTKRLLSHPWQHNAQRSITNHYDCSETEYLLKLLDRENFLCRTER
jgi:hypothetical protein